MYKYIYSVALKGIEGLMVRAESDLRDGLPAFNMVGYVSTQVREAGERVRSALYNSGFSMKPKKILVNLSPAGVKKEGTSFDLPIAMAILASIMDTPQEILNTTAFSGELSLDGEVRPVSGILPRVIAARENGMTRYILPRANENEAKAVEGIQVVGVGNLEEAALYMISGFKDLPENAEGPDTVTSPSVDNSFPDMADVRGQESVKRAVLVAVCGMHNLAIIGSAGSGKTMIAKRIPGIMPPLSFEESLEVTKIYSSCGLLADNEGIIRDRPFRNPHHTVTARTLCGSGNGAGEISLAHKGVLFLDEFPEFKQECIDSLREPMEDHNIRLGAGQNAPVLPAHFLAVSALNPCRCGYYPDRRKCRCTEAQIKKYVGKIGRPIWDRFDIIAVTENSDMEHRTVDKSTADSASMRKIVEKVRAIQAERFAGTGIEFNSEMNMNMIEVYCPLGEEERTFLRSAFNSNMLSGRGYEHVLQVARTIADIAGSRLIRIEHLAEAVHYRTAINSYIN